MVQTLEELEGEVWGEPDYDSYLVTTCHRLRKKPVDEFSVEDLRIMIAQGIGLKYLLPRALDALDREPLAAGDHYAGDLLWAVLEVEPAFLERHPVQARRIGAIAVAAISRLPPGDDDELKEKLEQFIGRWGR